jgi:hypothetical protein
MVRNEWLDIQLSSHVKRALILFPRAGGRSFKTTPHMSPFDHFVIPFQAASFQAHAPAVA